MSGKNLRRSSLTHCIGLATCRCSSPFPPGKNPSASPSWKDVTTSWRRTGWKENPSSSRSAAAYLRGIPFVQVPTTLLAQVDSSVGGKTGVNLRAGKNLVGAFYQPQLVLCDLDALKTLPKREYVSGLAEVIKYGVIYDAILFAQLERNLPKLLQRNAATLAAVVA